jgi:hypothetical protein
MTVMTLPMRLLQVAIPESRPRSAALQSCNVEDAAEGYCTLWPTIFTSACEFEVSTLQMQVWIKVFMQ